MSKLNSSTFVYHPHAFTYKRLPFVHLFVHALVNPLQFHTKLLKMGFQMAPKIQRAISNALSFPSPSPSPSRSLNGKPFR